ncbi:MAG: IS481 family transposase [Microbacteriaceae bacterium]|nr:IS481 family transposase [Microbacteriaceae bacterium]
MSHRNARLTPNGRRILVDRILSGRPVAHVAKELGVSRQCAHRWLARYRAEGPAGLEDRSSRRGPGLGFDYVHVAIDDHSRLAFAQILPDERGATCAAFLQAALDFFRTHGVRVREVMTDNAFNYVNSHDFQQLLRAEGIIHRRTRPYSPWQNGKAERFNRTLQERWAYRRAYASNEERAEKLGPFLDWYNYARPHHALGGKPPITRVSRTY